MSTVARLAVLDPGEHDADSAFEGLLHLRRSRPNLLVHLDLRVALGVAAARAEAVAFFDAYRPSPVVARRIPSTPKPSTPTSPRAGIRRILRRRRATRGVLKAFIPPTTAREGGSESQMRALSSNAAGSLTRSQPCTSCACAVMGEASARGSHNLDAACALQTP